MTQQSVLIKRDLSKKDAVMVTIVPIRGKVLGDIDRFSLSDVTKGGQFTDTSLAHADRWPAGKRCLHSTDHVLGCCVAGHLQMTFLQLGPHQRPPLQPHRTGQTGYRVGKAFKLKSAQLFLARILARIFARKLRLAQWLLQCTRRQREVPTKDLGPLFAGVADQLAGTTEQVIQRQAYRAVLAGQRL